MLAGGTGSRVAPFNTFVSKHLLGVNGKCIIDYPIKTLVAMGIENLTIVVGSSFSGQILDYVQDGSKFGLNVNYCYQHAPNGIAFAINLCKRFVADDDEFITILGDNIFSNDISWQNSPSKAQIVLVKHDELKRFGVMSLDAENKIVRIEEKPKTIDSNLNNYAISGCYKFDHKFFDYFQNLKPSARGEWEVTDIIKQYHADDKLATTFYDGLWVDAGTHESIAMLNNHFYTRTHSYGTT